MRYNRARANEEEVYSKRIKAGHRTYFFDVKATKNNDYYISVTESKKRFEDGTFIKNKIYLYKEDFNKFYEALGETIGHVKSHLLPEYNFEEYARRDEDYSAHSDSE